MLILERWDSENREDAEVKLFEGESGSGGQSGG
jgi:hypothetical protein